MGSRRALVEQEAKSCGKSFASCPRPPRRAKRRAKETTSEVSNFESPSKLQTPSNLRNAQAQVVGDLGWHPGMHMHDVPGMQSQQAEPQQAEHQQAERQRRSKHTERQPVRTIGIVHTYVVRTYTCTYVPWYVRTYQWYVLHVYVRVVYVHVYVPGYSSTMVHVYKSNIISKTT